MGNPDRAVDLVWVGGIERHIANYIFEIVSRQAIAREHTRLRLVIQAEHDQASHDTSYGKAQRRAYQQVLAALPVEERAASKDRGSQYVE